MFCLIKENLKELKIGAFHYVKRAILSYSLGKVEDRTKLPLQQEKLGRLLHTCTGVDPLT